MLNLIFYYFVISNFFLIGYGIFYLSLFVKPKKQFFTFISNKRFKDLTLGFLFIWLVITNGFLIMYLKYGVI